MKVHTVPIKSLVTLTKGSRGSSVSTVSDYGLDGQGLIPGRGKRIFPLASVSGGGGPFPGGKALPGHDADHPPQPSTKVMNE
jgi:hypothetical protein